MRANLKRTPQCCALEGRRLLTAAWGGHGMWDKAAAGDKPPAMIHPFVKGAESGHIAIKGSDGGRFGQRAAPSAQTRADMQTLQTDLKTLQSEIPASITAAVTADQATIKNALAALTPAQRKALMPSPGSWPAGSTTTTDPSAQITTLLTAANVPSAQIATIVSDFAAYQNALTTTDPTLQAKITADKAALAKDMPGMPADAPDLPPGGLGGFGGLIGPGFGRGMDP